MNDNDMLNSDIYPFLLDNNYFHDFTVKKIKFSLLKNEFKLILSEEKKIFSVIMKKIFSFVCNIDFLVEEKEYDTLSWNKLFKPLQYRNLISIDIKKSRYNDLSIKYLKRKPLKIIMNFNFGFNVEIDCIDILINENSINKRSKIKSIHGGKK